MLSQLVAGERSELDSCSALLDKLFYLGGQTDRCLHSPFCGSGATKSGPLADYQPRSFSCDLFRGVTSNRNYLNVLSACSRTCLVVSSIMCMYCTFHNPSIPNNVP